MNLAQEKCQPCEMGGIPLSREEAGQLLRQVKGWSLDAGAKKMSKKFSFKDFQGALAFVNRIGAAAETQGHHPDLHCGWGYVVVDLWTHAVGGLSRNDFILAAQIDDLELVK